VAETFASLSGHELLDSAPEFHRIYEVGVRVIHLHPESHVRHCRIEIRELRIEVADWRERDSLIDIVLVAEASIYQAYRYKTIPRLQVPKKDFDKRGARRKV
jgi:hypothetical protein